MTQKNIEPVVSLDISPKANFSPNSSKKHYIKCATVDKNQEV